MNRNGIHSENNHDRDEQLRELLAACARQDRRAFELLYQSTSAKLFGVLLRILDRRDTAQECLQDVYLKIWNNASGYKSHVAAPLTWMSTIARYQAIDHLRRHRREVIEADPGRQRDRVDLDGSPEEQTEECAEGERLDNCLRQLKNEQRQVLVLAYYKGLTHDELAKQTMIPVGTIKTWIRRGLHQLRSCLET